MEIQEQFNWLLRNGKVTNAMTIEKPEPISKDFEPDDDSPQSRMTRRASRDMGFDVEQDASEGRLVHGVRLFQGGREVK